MYCEEPVVHVQIRDVNFVLEGVGQIPPVSSFHKLRNLEPLTEVSCSPRCSPSSSPSSSAPVQT